MKKITILLAACILLFSANSISNPKEKEKPKEQEQVSISLTPKEWVEVFQRINVAKSFMLSTEIPSRTVQSFNNNLDSSLLKIYYQLPDSLKR